MKTLGKDLLPGDICETLYGSRWLVVGDHRGHKMGLLLPGLLPGLLFSNEELELLVRAKK